MIGRDQQRLLIAILLFPFTVAVATELISASSNGNQGDRASEYPSISADGNFVAFQSYATNLLTGMSTTGQNIFMRDRQKNSIELISMNSNGDQGDSYSWYPSISADGCFVAFQSYATNLLTGMSTTDWNIFMRDCQKNSIELISMNSNGDQGDNPSASPSISADGLFVAFHSDATNLLIGIPTTGRNIFVRGRQKDSIELISINSNGNQGNGHSWSPSISANGNFVAFESVATNLVDDDTNDSADIFVYDRNKKTIERVSIADDGSEGDEPSLSASISADGNFVAFASEATNLVDDDTNDSADIFVYDRSKKLIERVSITDDGREADGYSWSPSISADGRFVAFESAATNLVDDDDNQMRDIFVYDRTTKTIGRVSIADDGRESDAESKRPSISGDGSVVVFKSHATNLVAGGTNSLNHIFLAHRLVRSSAESVPAMGVGVLIALISLVGGMALRIRARSRH